jgi:leader peptidase (prepilin peptidase) / N-methyltransferase
MDTWGWVTVAGAGLAGLAVGGWGSAVTGWLPAREPDRRFPLWRGPASGTDDAVGRPADRRDRVAAVGLTAAAFVVLAIRFGPRPALPAFCFLAAVGVPLALIDARTQRLPDALTLPSYPVALVALGAAALATPDGGRHFVVALIGLAAGLVVFVAQVLIYPAGVGWGDVKLAGLLGLYLGWLGGLALFSGLVLSYLLAAVTGVALLVARRATRRSRIPFGPFLLAGTLAAILLSGSR